MLKRKDLKSYIFTTGLQEDFRGIQISTTYNEDVNSVFQKGQPYSSSQMGLFL
jgi:hypothetical protein